MRTFMSALFIKYWNVPEIQLIRHVNAPMPINILKGS